MTTARKSLICLSDTPYYHVVSRCVRRAWLCGVDAYTGCDYSHRKEWVIERLRECVDAFAIDVCAFAVMSNHYHLGLHVNQARARAWSDEQVVDQWTKLFSRHIFIDRWREGTASEAERRVVEGMIALWRHQLCDISWFMRCMNEHLARRANAEDGCTGRFFQGRFKSQALVDEAGLLAAMAYVDLNPIRAGIAETPETSEFTSIQARIRQATTTSDDLQNVETLDVPLLPFSSEVVGAGPSIPFSLREYLELVDWTGRLVREDKRGAIDSALPPLMQRLNIDPAAWSDAMQPGGNVFGRAMGRLNHLRLHAALLKQSWVRGVSAARRMFPEPA